MSDVTRGQSLRALIVSTLAFTVCFAVWMMNGVLVTWLVEHRQFTFDEIQIGWLLGIPVLTGSLLRLPVGVATDRYGGRVVFPVVMVVGALGAVALSQATTFTGFVVGSLGFGVAGTSFAVGVAYTALFFKKNRQGTALGVFGAGNAGSAITSLLGPTLLGLLTVGGTRLEGWRRLPLIYAGALILIAVLFVLLAPSRRVENARGVPLVVQLRVLRSVRVWRFGLYYFLVFGCFVALSQWLVPYYVNVFGTSLAVAGMLAAVFSLPSGLIRAAGGWLSDRFGARATMYAVLGVCLVGCVLLSIPAVEITTPGEGVSAALGGTVTAVSSDAVVVDSKRYTLVAPAAAARGFDEETHLLPQVVRAQEPVVRVGDVVKRKQLLVRGTTRIKFVPNVWLYTALVFIVGIAMGIGKAAVYKYIPEYFPGQVGVVGGLVGVIGGLGGFVCPILFGYLLRATGVWSSSWAFLFVLAAVSAAWLHSVVRGIERSKLRSIELVREPASQLNVPIAARLVSGGRS